MATAQLGILVRSIHLLAAGRRAGRETDRQLLDDFADRRDETAFTALVNRHGPMVLRVCRRVLRHEQDAEDAFQATFLVLARCATGIRRRETLPSWLHGVAYRTAMSAKRSAARRRIHEARLRDRAPANTAGPTGDDVQAVLDEEIRRLPESFRAAFVLCALNGQTVSAAAAELGIKEGTVASRLARSRQRLQRQLVRRGIQPSALLAVTSFAGGAGEPAGVAAGATLPFKLVAGAGRGVGVPAPHVAALAAEAMEGMFLMKPGVMTVLVLAACLVAAAAGAATLRAPTAEGAGTRSLATTGGEDFIPAPLKSVVGVIRDADTGKPIRGAVVAVEPAGNPAGGQTDLQAVTDREGHYLLTGLSRRDDYVVLARPPEGQPYLAAARARHDTPGREPITADFDLKRGVWITGRVVDRATGRPVRARIEYSPFAGNPFGAEVLAPAAANAPCRTRPEDGSFRVAGLRGRGLVCARATEGDYRRGVGANKINGARPGGDFATCPPVSPGDFHGLVEVNFAERDAIPDCEIALEPAP